MGISLSGCAPYKNVENMNSMTEDLKYEFPVKYADLSNDVKIAYVDEGSSEKTLIFIHGLGSYIPAWRKVIPELKSKYRCIAIDLPGYGKSSKGLHSGNMTHYASVVHEFIEKLNIENYTLVGHSMGGQISMTYSLMYPGEMNSMVLVAPAGFEDFSAGQKDWLEGVMTPHLVKSTTLEGIETNLYYNFYSMPDDAKFMIEDRIAMRTADDFMNYCIIVSRSVAGMVKEQVRTLLHKIDTPTLIVFGEKDNLIPNRYLNPGRTSKVAEYGHENIKGSKLVMIPKAGHFVGFEKAELVAEEINKFVN